MFEIQNYGSFIAAILLFQLIPGPGTIAILGATAKNGLKAGMGAVLGTLLGDLIYMLAAAAGLAVVLNNHPLLFQGLQWLGSLYLLWIGIQLLRTTNGLETGSAVQMIASGWFYFRRALVVALTNPKVVLFFVAFFPLFIRADASSTTLLVMMLHVTLISLLYQTLLVLLGNQVALRLKAIPSLPLVATRLAGVAMIGFGIKLAASNR